MTSEPGLPQISRAEAVAASIVDYIRAQNVRYADRDKAVQHAYKGMVRAIEDAIAHGQEAKEMSDAISSAAMEICECCKRPSQCRMYVLQSGNTAWVCHPCRNGQSENGK